MSGWYRIDPELGIVYGIRGKPIRSKDSYGYIRVLRRATSKRKNALFLAHRMIWEFVNGPIPAGLVINHINGIKTDNRIANLELVTQAENMKHAFRTGLANMTGEAHPQAKLTAERVLFIRQNAGVLTDSQMAAMFGVCKEAVRDARRGKNWSHLPGGTG